MTDICDLCQTSDPVIVSGPNPLQGKIALCRRCGLFFASPRLEAEALERFYGNEFTGDAGANALAREDGTPSTKKVRSEERRVKRWSLPLIQRHATLAGKDILDLRMRSGALAAAMTAAGGRVTAIDPFTANVQYARERRKLSLARQLPMTEIHRLEGFGKESFDIVTAMTIHLLAHLQSPGEFLQRTLQVLRPGGWLFLMEKDVLRPNYNVARPTPFSSGTAHQYHLTRDTMALYLRAAGFELIQCRIDPHYATGQNRVITAIARKPERKDIQVPADLFKDGPAPQDYLKRVQRIQHRWRMYALAGRARKRWWKFREKWLPTHS